MYDDYCKCSTDEERKEMILGEFCYAEFPSFKGKGKMEAKGEGKRWFLRGAKDGIPIGLGYFAVAFALGIAAKKAGMSAFEAGAMSVLMVASAGQYAAITVIATGGGYLQMAVTTLIVNLRYLLMSCALSQKVAPELKLRHRFLLSYPVTDEIFGIAMSVEGRLNPFYNYGAAAVSVPCWTAGAFLGAAAGEILPPRIENALSVALYGMFLAIIIPAGKKNKIVAAVVALSMLCSLAFTRLPMLREVSSGMQIILLTVLIAGAAAYFFPIRETEGEEEHES